MDKTVKYTISFMIADLVTTILFDNPIEAKIALLAMIGVIAYAFYILSKKGNKKKRRQL